MASWVHEHALHLPEPNSCHTQLCSLSSHQSTQLAFCDSAQQASPLYPPCWHSAATHGPKLLLILILTSTSPRCRPVLHGSCGSFIPCAPPLPPDLPHQTAVKGPRLGEQPMTQATFAATSPFGRCCCGCQVRLTPTTVLLVARLAPRSCPSPRPVHLQFSCSVGTGLWGLHRSCSLGPEHRQGHPPDYPGFPPVPHPTSLLALAQALAQGWGATPAGMRTTPQVLTSNRSTSSACPERGWSPQLSPALSLFTLPP